MAVQALNFNIDLNNDGVYSLWELWHVVKDLYHAPGNLVIEGLGHIPFIAEPLGIRASEAAGYASLDSILAVLLSLMFWTALLFTALSRLSPDAAVESEKANNSSTSFGSANTHAQHAQHRSHKKAGTGQAQVIPKARPASLTGHLMNKPRKFATSRLRRAHHNPLFYKRSRPPI